MKEKLIKTNDLENQTSENVQDCQTSEYSERGQR